MRLAYFIIVIALLLSVPSFVFGFGEFGRAYLVYGGSGVLLAAAGSFVTHALERGSWMTAAWTKDGLRPMDFPATPPAFAILGVLIILATFGMLGVYLLLADTREGWALALAFVGMAGILLGTLWGYHRISRMSH